jgi:hypothetical protein
MDKVDTQIKYEEYIDQNLTLKSFQLDAQAAYKFITRFNALNK